MKAIRLLFMLSLLAPLSLSAQQVMWLSSLDSTGTGSNSAAKGTAWALLSADRKTLTYQITIAKLQGTLTLAEFEISPSFTPVGSILFNGNTAAGTWTNIPDSLITYLARKHVYINIRSSISPAGEIRGYLKGSQFGFTMNIDSTLENSGSKARGTGWARWDSGAAGGLKYAMTIAGLSSAFNTAHFRWAGNGAILQQVAFTDSTAIGDWSGSPDSIITVLLHGKVYLNVETANFSNGEIRGTVTPVGQLAFESTINGAQAGSGSTGSGTGWAILNSDLSRIRYSVTYARLLGSTFSGGYIQSNANPSIFQLPFSSNYASGDWTSFTDANLVDLMKGNLFINLRSSRNPQGELQGALVLSGPVFTAKLDGAQAGTPSVAHGTAWVDNGQDTSRYRVTIAGLVSSFSAAQFHYLPGGGAVQTIAFTDSTGSGSWLMADSMFAAALRGKLYVSVQSMTYPGDEIRGNIGLGDLVVTKVEQVSSETPRNFRLEQNYPNPFNPTTAISYQLSAVGNVSLRVFDLLGREVAELVHERQSPGTYTVTFDAEKISSGIYFYRLTTGAGQEATRKMVLLK
ncbi:MAG TPA: CHRD domain-containing protein [Bacteroidota bacterium]|nr:CHRD domain-containing protein [Bacteroidota bacterium]